MARRRLRDQLTTPSVARAMTSPSAIVLAGVGVAVGVAASLPIVAVVGLGAAGWAGRVALAVGRGPRRERIDPFALGEPWRHWVREAVQAQSRFDQVVRGTRPGPFKDRLVEIGDRLAVGVDETWRVARHGQRLREARRRIDVNDVSRQLEAARRDADEAPADASSLARTTEALEAQLASAERMDGVIAETRDRLRLLDARLGEAVARSVELSIQVVDVGQLGGLGADVDDAVDELEALRLALDEASGPPEAGQP